MPNQRSKTKVALNGWIDRKLSDEIIKIAKSQGKAKSQLVAELLQQEVDAYNCTQSRTSPPQKV